MSDTPAGVMETGTVSRELRKQPHHPPLRTLTRLWQEHTARMWKIRECKKFCVSRISLMNPIR